jgi:serine protease
MTTKKPTETAKRKGKIISRPKSSKPDYRTQIVVQFHDGINLPYGYEVSRLIKDYKVGPWEQLAKKYPGITISPLYSSIKPEKLKQLIAKAKQMDPTYKEGNFFQCFTISCPAESLHQSVIDELSVWNNVKKVGLLKKLNHPTVGYSDEDEFANQGYLNDAPEGIGSIQVWGKITPPTPETSGSDGTGIKFIDIETRWKLDHEDLPVDNPATPSTDETINCLYGDINPAEPEDGTAVLGIIGAVDNTIGCVGIAPSSTIDVVSYYGTGNSLPNAIVKSLDHLGFGDVLLIEAQTTLSESGNPFIGYKIPVETIDTVYNAIRLATALGIIVVEPGGNGIGFDTLLDTSDDLCINLNDLTIGGNSILNPGNASQFKDSGAIIVTASRSSSPGGMHEKMLWAPKGDRVDCYAWGENITTLSADDPSGYVHNYGGTSGAAAIIAGAILSMQGMAIANQGYRFSPLQIRNILRDSAYGTPLAEDPGTGTIEQIIPAICMPNLAAFAASCLNAFPDLYLRDYIGDDGLPHSGSISCSPDVINKQSIVADPQAEFGGSNLTNRDNGGLSENALFNVENYLYFRALNQGGVTPTNAKVTAYYSIPTTLITPSLIELIGQTDFPIAIPVGDAIDNLTVSNVLRWTPTQAAGHHCFVAIISCDEDPSVDLKKIPDWDWDTYCRYIKENNNVTWKNFELVEMKKSSSVPVHDEDPDQAEAPKPDPVQEQDPLPDPQPNPNPNPKGWLGLDFISPGLPHKDQRMNLEVISKLPKGVNVLLQVPLAWKKLVFRGSPYVLHNKKRKIGYAPLNPFGNSKLEDILFKANSKTKLKLFVNVPDKLKTQSYTIAVRQMLEGKEVGRFTWKLVPPKKGIKHIEKRVVKKPVKKR